MKISDWETRVSNKYQFTKTTNVEDLKSCITNYQNTSFYTALKKDNLFFYIKTINSKYSGFGAINGDNESIFTLIFKFLKQHLEQSIKPIELNDLISYFANLGFEEIKFENLVKTEQEKIKNELTFKSSFISENHVTDDEFYGGYIFENLKGILPSNTGFCKTFVILGSLDKINICSYYIMTDGTMQKQEENDFIQTVQVEDLNTK